jgi:PAS domain S-box-containing protein
VKKPFEYLVLEPGNAWIASVALIAAIALVDWQFANHSSLELAYFLPVGLAGLSLGRGSLAFLSALSAGLGEQFGPFHWGESWQLRLTLAFFAYLGVALFFSEATRNRKAAAAHNSALETELERRESAEHQLRSLVEGSPAAILTVDPEGNILLANEAAHELFQCEPQTLPGQSIDDYLPMVANFRQTKSLRKLVRTMIECECRRKRSEPILAHVWVSSSGPPATTGLSAVVFDASQQVRDREEGALHTLTLGARIVASSYFHEVRNLCNAMRVLTTRLERIPGVEDTEEVDGLHSLVKGLEALTSVQMKPDAEVDFDVASLRAVLNHLKIVVTPWFDDASVDVQWYESPDLPLVRADQSALLQVFLNLARNALRAVEAAEIRKFSITATVESRKVLIRFRNTGLPVKDPKKLFQPFQPEAAGSGLGLHVSHAIIRSFGGELRYDPESEGPCFTVVLEPRKVSEMFED